MRKQKKQNEMKELRMITWINEQISFFVELIILSEQRLEMAMKLNLSIGDMLGNTDRTRDSACPINLPEQGTIGTMRPPL